MKHRGQNALEQWQTAGFGLYVHWPFCQSKCPYCDFNSHVSQSIDVSQWADAYLKELARWRAWTGPRRLTSIFFGGGTPSLMPPDLVGDVITAALSHWQPANDLEVTLEANPTSVEIGKFRGFYDAGVNRVSIGVQSLNDADLRRLGRMHDAQEARKAIETAQAVFDRTSFDLIYGRQDQSLGDWRAELTDAIAIGSRHMSLYQLTIEPNTVFGERYRRGKLSGLPDEDLGADMYALTQDLCGDAGLIAYEVSNHCIGGEESRHNMIYWNCGDYVGIGPGAHGRLTDTLGRRYASDTPKSPAAWIAASLAERIVADDLEPLTPMEVAEEQLVMGLRLSSGVDLAVMKSSTGYGITKSSQQKLCEIGVVERDGTTIRTTNAGRPLLNAVLAALVLSDQPEDQA